MKLRVRINKQTTRLELQSEEPTLTELSLQIKEIVFPSHGLSPDTDFTLSLNGTESLSDTGQTLASCGVVPGDLICVILPQSGVGSRASSSSPAIPTPSNTGGAPQALQEGRAKQTSVAPANEPSTSKQVATMEVEPKQEVSTSEEQEMDLVPHAWEPMLCSEAEEGKVPFSLEVLHHGAQSSSSTDSLMVAVHCLMVETGFIPQGSEVKSGEMPGGWRAAGAVYRLQYAHPLCEGSLATVVAVSMGPVFVVTATLKVNETVDTVRRLTLDPSSYVTDKWAGESAAAVFKDLGKLSRIVRDQLVYPLITTAREAMALPAVFGLCALPPELLLRVLRLLDVRSLVTLSTVNTHLHNATADPVLWRHLYCRDFRDSNASRDTDWKELYKAKYKLRQEYRQMLRVPRPRPLPHPLPPFYPTPNNPFNPLNPLPFPPGIIGGEYDQRPGVPHGILPRPRYDPIGPLPGQDAFGGGFGGRRGSRPGGGRPSDIRRGFI